MRRAVPDGGSAAVEAVLADAAAGDGTALAALGEIGRWLGIGLAGLVNVLNRPGRTRGRFDGCTRSSRRPSRRPSTAGPRPRPS